MRPLLLHKSCQTKAIVDFSDLTIRMPRQSYVLDFNSCPCHLSFQRSHELLFNYVIVTARYRASYSTDVPTIYWRVNSSLDGALLLNFITQGPLYEPFTHIGLLRLKSRKVVFP